LVKIKAATIEISQSESFINALNTHVHKGSGDLGNTIETIVTARLQELTPLMVKEMLHNLMREHLGWLVVWGGGFGGLIGVASVFLL
jgi:hypothetical protein